MLQSFIQYPHPDLHAMLQQPRTSVFHTLWCIPLSLIKCDSQAMSIWPYSMHCSTSHNFLKNPKEFCHTRALAYFSMSLINPDGPATLPLFMPFPNPAHLFHAKASQQPQPPQAHSHSPNLEVLQSTPSTSHKPQTPSTFISIVSLLWLHKRVMKIVVVSRVSRVIASPNSIVTAIVNSDAYHRSPLMDKWESMLYV